LGAAKLVPLQRAHPRYCSRSSHVVSGRRTSSKNVLTTSTAGVHGVDPRAEVGERGAAAAVEGADGDDAGSAAG
jgi:hypothetical protein